MSKRSIAAAAPALAAILALAGLVAGCSSPAPAGDSTAVAKPAAFTVTPAQRARLHIVTLADTAFTPTLEVTGTVAFNGDRSTQVLAPISGPVTRLIADIGAVVKAGAPLAAVTSPDYASAVAGYRKAQDASRNAQRILTLDEQLFQNDALARSDLDQARTDASSAAADVDAAIQTLRSLGVSDSAVARLRSDAQAGP
ncbi:MAG: efflux RND transporter periplasmic adaptor subunit, partial [Gemmatimonadota bacterium]|nr:efflux RND transporter periplasmic adaptor subunit [Gemmatimonadota bacterium]